MKTTSRAVCSTLLALAFGACSRLPFSQNGDAPAAGSTSRVKVVAPADLRDFAAIVPELARHRVVFVGEIHDRYEDHLTELEIVRALADRWPEMAIAVEWFQQPFQKALDDYVAGNIDEQAMLRETEYFDRWGFDFRLVRPILRHARERKIPLVALNVPREVTHEVAKSGLAGLTAEDRRWVPADVDRSDPEYRRRVEEAFDAHPKDPHRSFDRFFEAQLLWDEGMAARLAETLREHPNLRIVVLAGAGHVAFRSGIPRRVERRLGIGTAVVLGAKEQYLDPAAADYLIARPLEDLPPRGVLGVALKQEPAGVVSLLPRGAAEHAGIRKGDVIVAIAGERVRTAADVRIALVDALPGSEWTVEVERRRVRKHFRVVLDRERREPPSPP